VQPPHIVVFWIYYYLPPRSSCLKMLLGAPQRRTFSHSFGDLPPTVFPRLMVTCPPRSRTPVESLDECRRKYATIKCVDIFPRARPVSSELDAGWALAQLLCLLLNKRVMCHY